MAASPWFPWYASDWLNDEQLRNCSKAQRGTWADVLSLMHMSNQRGILREPLAKIAKNSRSRIADLRALVAANVMRGSDETIAEPVLFRARHAGRISPAVVLIAPQHGPIWYSKRMVEDEYKRCVRAGITMPLVSGQSPPSVAHQTAPSVAHQSPHPTRAIAREGEGEGEGESHKGPIPAGAGPDPRAPARMCACEDDAQPETGLTVQEATAILATAGLALQPHDQRVVELLRAGVDGYELQLAAAKAARNGVGNWLPYLRATIQGMRDDIARPLAGVPMNGSAATMPKDYHAMMDAAARELAEFEAQKGRTQ